MKGHEDKIDLTVGESTKLDGDITSKGSIRIDGSVKGNIESSNLVIIGEKGKINGNITADKGIIGGNIKGNISISDYLELNPTAKIKGDISAKVLQVDKGAEFNGNCLMGKQPEKNKPEKSK